MTNFYIIIPEEFAFNLQNQESSINAGSFFGFAKTIDGRFVCSSNSVNDFPEEFAELGELTIVALDQSNFEPSPPIEN